MTLKKTTWTVFVVFAVSTLFLLFFYSFTKFAYLSFSDSAKYADIARNLIQEKEYSTSFTFFRGYSWGVTSDGYFKTLALPIHTFIISAFFRLFGMSDFAVTFTSMAFFVLSSVLIYLFGKKFFGVLVVLLSSLAFSFTPDVLNYAVSGGTESVFIFEILLSTYLLSGKTRTGNLLGFIVLVAMYFTRPQAFIYIAGILLFWLLKSFKVKKALSYFGLAMIFGVLVDIFVLGPVSGKFFLYSILDRGSFSALSLGAGQASADILRASVGKLEIAELSKKIFYNLYNFYKLAPQIINPYILGLFIIGLFRPFKTKAANAFKWASLFMVVLTLISAAASIPLFRYIHPVIPFVYIIGIDTLVWIITKISDDFSELRIKIYDLRLKITKPLFVSLISFFLVFIFVIGQTLGVIFLDSRFEKKTHNAGKPPIYVEMSRVLKVDTNKNDVVITNLDTWGSWYGERKTVWFPLEPSQLNLGDGKNHFDAIYLTNYLMDDANYYMGDTWRQIFQNPENIKDDYVGKNFEFYKEYAFPAFENYENIEGRAVLLIRKDDADTISEWVELQTGKQ